MTPTRQNPGAVPTAMLGLLSSGACLTIAQIAEELKVLHRQVTNAGMKLIARGYLERHSTGCFQLTPAGLAAAQAGERITSGPRGPTGKVHARRDTLRERAWRAMRVRRTFTVQDLASDASREGDHAEANIQKYLHQLGLAGIVTWVGRQKGVRPGSNGFRVYRLGRDLGPRAPVYRAEARAVRDMNTGEDLPCAPRS